MANLNYGVSSILIKNISQTNQITQTVIIAF